MRWEKNGIVGYNHQMPSVVRLNDNKGLAAAVETNNSGYHISLAIQIKTNGNIWLPIRKGLLIVIIVFFRYGTIFGTVPFGRNHPFV